MPLASVALDEARFLLNDVGAKLYTNTVLLPALKKAYRELQQQLVDNGVSVAREQTAEIEVPANTIEISIGAGANDLPENLLYPIMVHEKFQNESDTEYRKMEERTWTPDLTPSDRLQYWSWRESNTMFFIGAVGIVEIRVRYWGSLSVIADETTNIPILDSETFLAARTAALAAFSIGGNAEKAGTLSGDANSALEVLISTAVKNRQALPVRRRPFRAFRYGSRLFWRS